MRVPLRPLVTASLAGLTSLSVVAATSSTAAADQPTTPYVALGDSYSAGSGVLPLDPSASPLCARTTRNYPNVVAQAIGASKAAGTFTDVTCGGAQTKDFYSSQYWGVAPQLDAVTRDTKLVTLSIGGNDNDTFIGAIVACGSAGAATLGFGSPCKDLYGNKFKNDVLTKTAPAVRKALEDIHAKAPSARVAIVGYPWILPPTGGCFLTMPIAKGDVPYVRDLQATLNQVVEDAAAATGSEYVDLSVVSEGHDACKPIGTRWVEPLLWGTNVVPVHPNALGEAKMAEQVLLAL